MRWSLRTLALAVGLLFCSAPAFAVTPPPTGITISPPLQKVNIIPGTNQETVNFTLTNNEAFPQVIQLKTADFNSLNDSGGLLFVGTSPQQLKQEYGLAKWLVLPSTNIVAPPHQAVPVSVLVQNRPDLAPGGHYGALLFYLGNNGSSRGQVNITPVATALLFVTNLNGATYRLDLQSVQSPHSFFKLPTSVSFRFYNKGNTFLTPRGFITLTDPHGKLVAKGIINAASSLILPQTVRNYAVPLQTVALSKGVGNYTLTVNYRFDGLNQYRAYRNSLFLGTPGLLAAIFVVGLIAVLLALTVR